MRLISAALAATAFTGYALPALAGAWTQKEGDGQVIVNLWLYQTDEFYTNTGSTASQLTYQKIDLNPYVEYGLTDTITLGANLSLQVTGQDTASGTPQINGGLGDSEFFARFQLWKNDDWVISAEPLFKLPSPESSSGTPVIGGDDPDAALAFLVGHNFSAFGRQHYADASIAYRYRFGSPNDQMRYALTAGINVADDWDILPQLFITQRMNQPAAATFTQSSGDDFNLTKIQVSAVYHYTHDVAFQVGAFSHIEGKNAGAGDGALFAVWKEF